MARQANGLGCTLPRRAERSAFSSRHFRAVGRTCWAALPETDGEARPIHCRQIQWVLGFDRKCHACRGYVEVERRNKLQRTMNLLKAGCPDRHGSYGFLLGQLTAALSGAEVSVGSGLGALWSGMDSIRFRFLTASLLLSCGGGQAVAAPAGASHGPLLQPP